MSLSVTLEERLWFLSHNEMEIAMSEMYYRKRKNVGRVLSSSVEWILELGRCTQKNRCKLVVNYGGPEFKQTELL